MTAGSRGWAARRARDAVLDHVLRLVAGLPEAAAQDRFAEIVSDLHEQAAASDAAGRSSLRLAGAIVRRAVLGLPADAAWRRGRLVEERARVGALPVLAAVPLRVPAAERAFDQTNGAVDFDPRSAERPDEAELRLLQMGAALNASFNGFGGGL